MLPALVSAPGDDTHETGVTICSANWVLHLVISHTRHGVRFVTGIGFCARSACCDVTHKTGGTSFYGCWVLRLVRSHTREGVRFATGIGFSIL